MSKSSIVFNSTGHNSLSNMSTISLVVSSPLQKEFTELGSTAGLWFCLSWVAAACFVSVERNLRKEGKRGVCDVCNFAAKGDDRFSFTEAELTQCSSSFLQTTNHL